MSGLSWWYQESWDHACVLATAEAGTHTASSNVHLRHAGGAPSAATASPIALAANLPLRGSPLACAQQRPAARPIAGKAAAASSRQHAPRQQSATTPLSTLSRAASALLILLHLKRRGCLGILGAD